MTQMTVKYLGNDVSLHTVRTEDSMVNMEYMGPSPKLSSVSKVSISLFRLADETFCLARLNGMLIRSVWITASM